MSRLKQQGVHVARRRSGGGTVYHVRAILIFLYHSYHSWVHDHIHCHMYMYMYILWYYGLFMHLSLFVYSSKLSVVHMYLLIVAKELILAN